MKITIIIIIWFFVLLFMVEYYGITRRYDKNTEIQLSTPTFFSSAVEDECKMILMSDDKGNIFSKETNFIPPGTIIFSRENNEPPGWAMCNGRIYDPVQHPELHKALGSPPTPELPNLQGFILAGKGAVYSGNILSEVPNGSISETLTLEQCVHEHPTKIEGKGVRETTSYNEYNDDGSLKDIHDGFWFWTLTHDVSERRIHGGDDHDAFAVWCGRRNQATNCPEDRQFPTVVLPKKTNNHNPGSVEEHNNIQQCFVGYFLIKL